MPRPALAAEQEDGRVGLWVRVRLGGASVTQSARELDYADPSGVTRTVQRLEARAGEERELGRRLADLRRRLAISNAKR